MTSEWNVLKGKYVYNIRTGKKDANAEDIDGKYPFFTCSSEPLKINTYSFDTEALLVAGNGIVGFTQYYKGKFDAYQRTYVLDNFDKRFLATYLKYYVSNQLTDYVADKSQGSVIEFIKLGDLKNFPIRYPALPTQNKIVDYLDKKVFAIDSLIEKEEKAVEELEKYKMNLITNKVFGSVETEKSLKYNWLTVKLSDDYKIEKLKFYVSFSKGLSITKDNLIEEGIPVISYGQIHAKFNTGTRMKDEMLRYVDDEYLKTGRKALLKVDDFIFADTSEDEKGTGNFALNDIDGHIFAGYHTIVARPKKDLVSKYFAYQFLTDVWRNQVRSLCDGTRSYSITQKILSETFVIIPPKIVQENVVKYLDKKCEAIDKLLELKEEKIEKLKEYKKSLIYECVTGRRQINA